MPSSSRNRRLSALHSLPTRRSSDLAPIGIKRTLSSGSSDLTGLGCSLPTKPNSSCCQAGIFRAETRICIGAVAGVKGWSASASGFLDRKSTRLNSSHLGISYAVFFSQPPSLRTPLSPYTTLFRSRAHRNQENALQRLIRLNWTGLQLADQTKLVLLPGRDLPRRNAHLYWCRGGREGLVCQRFRLPRSEEHTSELQSLRHIVCRLLLATAVSPHSTLSLHDALPISRPSESRERSPAAHPT